MKKYLLPESGNDYKANLHCHSKISDGGLTPEELKKAYSEHGYSVLAYTDHGYFVPHNDLTDDNFLALNGYEVDVTDKNGKIHRTCHFVLIACDEDNTEQIIKFPSRYLPADIPVDCEYPYDQEVISKMMQKGRDAGFFVIYAHPNWSQERYPEYMAYHGMHAMEIVNYGSIAYGWDEVNDHVYEDMVRGGERIFCVATDDNHNWRPLDSRYSDSFGGFTVIRAEKLEYKTITDALLRGDLYASEAPLIRDLYIEDGKVTITTSPVDHIFFETSRRRADVRFAEPELLTEATFDIPDNVEYIRLIAVDEHGKKAFTNAYFLD